MKEKPMTALNSYKRWQKEKRNVKKGEKSLFILAPLTYKKEDSEELDKSGLEIIKTADKISRYLLKDIIT